jgi:hypothetical protein
MPLTPEEEDLEAFAELIEELELKEKEGPPPAPPPRPELVRLVSCSFKMECFKDHQRVSC